MMGSKELVADFLKGKVPDSLLDKLEIPRDTAMGDIALPCFALAPIEKRSPVEIAKDLASHLAPAGAIASIVAVGPYVNFRINKAALAKIILGALKGKTMGIPRAKPLRQVFEYTQPNTNKPLHMGHVRNMLLGQACVRLANAVGHKAFSVNINNDRGVHICKSMLAYNKWGKGRPPNKKSDHFVGDFYVLYNQKVKGDPSLEAEIQEMLRQWEAGDPNVRALWKKMNAWALKGFAQTYRTFGVKYDKEYFESDLYLLGKKEVEAGLKKGLFKKNEDGAVIAELSKFGLPDKVLLRKDGTAVYMTFDIAFAKIKVKDFKADKSVYVVGSEQNLHFEQLFKILELQGYPADMCYHLSYGMVSLPSGRMKSREGQTADADDIVEEMLKLTRGELKKRYKLSKTELERRARIIAFAAIRFFMLKFDPQKDFVFNPEESLNFEGETGPYILYTYARIRSIFRKGKIKGPPKANFSLLGKPEEEALLTWLSLFPGAVEGAAEKLRPSILAHYLLGLAQCYNEYYHRHGILSAEKGVKEARLVLSDAVARTLQYGLGLLGIQTLEAM